jgi:hypothetical protein
MADETIQIKGLWLYYWYTHSDYVKMALNHQQGNGENIRNMDVRKSTFILRKKDIDEGLWERLQHIFDENFDASAIKDDLPELLDFLQYKRNDGNANGPVSDEVVSKFLWENEKRRKITDQINRRVAQHEPADERSIIQNYLKAHMQVHFTDIFNRFDDEHGTIFDILAYLENIYKNNKMDRRSRNMFNNFYRVLDANGSYKIPSRSNRRTRKQRQ